MNYLHSIRLSIFSVRWRSGALCVEMDSMRTYYIGKQNVTAEAKFDIIFNDIIFNRFW